MRIQAVLLRVLRAGGELAWLRVAIPAGVFQCPALFTAFFLISAHRAFAAARIFALVWADSTRFLRLSRIPG